MSYTSYVAKPAPGAASRALRPVTFLFNGGPLAATVALREGLAPVRTAPGRRPGEFVYQSNPQTLLDISDLVFVDAPGTGYGRVLTEKAKTDLWGVEEDGRAFAQFIQAWRASDKRPSAPIYIMGESYGGVRAGVLVRELAAQSTPVEGVILISPTFTAGSDGYFAGVDAAVAALPTQAAIARFHGRSVYSKLSVEQAANVARTFASTTYAAALARGDSLAPQERLAIAREISDLTGATTEKVLADDLRLTDFGDAVVPGQRIGRADGRYHAPIGDMLQLPPPYDEPGSSLVRDHYDRISALDGQYRYGFGYRPKAPFVYLSLEASRRWNTKVEGGSLSVPELLKRQMAANPRLNVLLLGGYFDTTVPYAAAAQAFTEAQLPPGRLSIVTLAAGHAVFSDPVASKRAKFSLRAFYGKNSAETKAATFPRRSRTRSSNRGARQP